MKHLRTIFKSFITLIVIILFFMLENKLVTSYVDFLILGIAFGFFLPGLYQKLDQWFDKIVICYKGPSDLYLIEMSISWIDDYRKSLWDFSPLGEENQWYCLYELAYYRNELIKRKTIRGLMKYC